MKKIFYIAVLFAMLCSCTKEIEIDYRDIEEIPVIEGLLTTDKAEVKITKSRNMDDSTKMSGIKVDDVKIIMPSGEEKVLDFQSDGCYRLLETLICRRKNLHSYRKN